MRTCCIVGSSKIPAEKAQLVDSHDVVIRINHGLEPNKKIGDKTTIYMLGIVGSLFYLKKPVEECVSHQLKEINEIWLCYHCDSSYKPLREERFAHDTLKKFGATTNIGYALDFESYCELKKTIVVSAGWSADPTSGLVTVIRCIKDFEKVSIIGFGGLKDREFPNFMGHNYNVENFLIKQFIKDDKVVLLDD